MRDLLTSGLEIVGVILLAAFVWFVWRPAGVFAVAGVACLLAAHVHARPAGMVDDDGGPL